MPIEPETNDPLGQLRWLAASDPKRARALFHDLLKGPEAILESILRSASRPGDGRLRQIIATVFRTDPTANHLAKWLQQWLEVEPDEFTKAAIATALAAQTTTSEQRPVPKNHGANVVEAYRYVADRLCHRIRNALSLPSAQLSRLEQLALSTTDPNLKSELLEIQAGMQTGLRRIARNVEFDTGDDYLVWQPIAIVPWLEQNASEFAARFGQSKFLVTCDHTVRRVAIRANRFLLETIFANIWSNAVQASDSVARINVQCTQDNRLNNLEMIILDSGSGFPESQLETAFHQAFSTKDVSRGRGLLEIADATARLQGSVQLMKDADGRYRIALRLPLEAT